MSGMSLELTLPGAALHIALQRSLDLVGFGLQAAENATPADLSIPGAFGHVVASKTHSLETEPARDLFRAWVLANGLRECVEALGPALEWARRFCFLWTRTGSASPHPSGEFQLAVEFTSEEWNTFIGGERRFDRLPLPDKLQYLLDTYGFPLPELSAHILSLNATRNCLSHRSGIVSEADLKLQTDPGLLIRWRELEIAIGEEANRRVVGRGDTGEAGERLTVLFVDAERIVPIGSRVVISPTEYTSIALTFLLFGQQLQESVEVAQNRRRPPA